MARLNISVKGNWQKICEIPFLIFCLTVMGINSQIGTVEEVIGLLPDKEE
jgi:hypothetical protein